MADDRIDALTMRERDALRLLLAGHDAKSAAGELGLSVHSVNDRLRNARRKLGVGSSREAARLLARHEGRTPESFPENPADERLAVAPSAVPGRIGRTLLPARATPRTVRIIGAALAMSMLIATLFLAAALQPTAPASGDAPAAGAVTEAATEAAAPARDWLAHVDAGRWVESWRSAAAMFRAATTADDWAATVEAARTPLGPLAARAFDGAERTATLPGAPDGDYAVLRFRSRFANKRDAVETVLLTREADGWKVAGYFIR